MEGVLSVVSETVWPYLEEKSYQGKHSWCCSTKTWDWGKKKAKMMSQHLLNPWLEAIGVIIHLKDTRTKP